MEQRLERTLYPLVDILGKELDIPSVIEIRQTAVYSKWFAGLRDLKARVQIVRRIERIEAGNFGDAASVGEGVSELRLHHGPGYRIYFARRGDMIVLLLCGGDKATQARDIRAAKAMAKEWLL